MDITIDDLYGAKVAAEGIALATHRAWCERFVPYIKDRVIKKLQSVKYKNKVHVDELTWINDDPYICWIKILLKSDDKKEAFELSTILMDIKKEVGECAMFHVMLVRPGSHKDLEVLYEPSK